MINGVISPMTRIVPQQGAQISGHFIPGGVSSPNPRVPIPHSRPSFTQTIVGISNCFVHGDPDIFPEPHVFNPDRWLLETTPAKDEQSQSLDHWLVAFSKGPRSCLGVKYVFPLIDRSFTVRV